MLTALHIHNIALIEECHLTLARGLNILSGETGAGKSIVIDALSFVLGSRADRTLIRYGADRATVEGEFEVDESIFPLLEELGVEPETTLIIRRTMTDSKNEIKVNGQSFTLAMLKRLGSQLVDIHGQHEHQSLLKTATHLTLLDRYGQESIAPLALKVKEAYKRYKDLDKMLSSYGDERARERRLETLAFEIEDIRKVDPKEGEEEELAARRERFHNAEKIVGGVAESVGYIDGDEGVGALSSVSMALSRLNTVARYDDKLADLAARLESVKIELDDVGDTLKDYVESFDYDAKTAEMVENRFDQLKRLRRRYGNTLSEVLEYYDQAQEEYDKLLNASAEIEKLAEQKQKAKIELYNLAVKLSKARKAAAVKFEKEICDQLADLAMKSTFAVQFAVLPDIDDMDASIGSDGMDQAEFLISPNPGEPLRPLSRIASGGEMSRFMLALKNIIARLDHIDTMVFDEIDTGISGKVAHTVAQKLYNISRLKQVIAITHLPQLAAFSDHHYLISKGTEGGKTRTGLLPLTGDSKAEEVARLAGSQTQAGLLHAKELIASADEYKRSLDE